MADAADSEFRRLLAAFRKSANEYEAARKKEASNPPIIRLDQYGHKEVMKSDNLRKAELGNVVASGKFQKFAHTPDGAQALARHWKMNSREEELKGLFGMNAREEELKGLFGARRRRTAKKSGRKTGKKARKTRMLKSRRRY